MVLLRKCRYSKVQRTQLYFTVLSLTFIVSLGIIIWRHSVTDSYIFQQSPITNTDHSRNNAYIKTVEIEGTIEKENGKDVRDTNHTFSKLDEKSIDKLKEKKKIDYVFIETGKSSDETNIHKVTFRKRNSRLDSKNGSFSSDFKNRRNELFKQDWQKDGHKIQNSINNNNDDDKSEAYEMTKDNEVTLSKDDLNNKTQGIINEDWVVALRSRTSRRGILRKRNLHWTIALAGSYSGHLFTPPAGEIPRQRLPQAIIIGIGHCGTRALLDFLNMHPYIVTSNSEIHFYDRDANFAKGYSWYKAQMPLSYSNQITMEKTPCYIWSERAMNEIYKTNKKTKLIVIMKDPVARLVSMKLTYKQELLRTGAPLTTPGFLNSIYDSNVLIHGAYVKFLKPWFNKFPISQIHVLEGSDFITDPAKEIMKLESFLHIPHYLTEMNFYFNDSKGFYCMRPLHTNKGICLNDNKGRKHARLDPVLETRLYEYYSEYNEKLFQLLGRRYSWEAPE